MQMNAENVSRALQAMSDLVDLLRLAQGAAQRFEAEAHAPINENAENLSEQIHHLRRHAEEMQREVEQYLTAAQQRASIV